jgi:hypothetical protein
MVPQVDGTTFRLALNAEWYEGVRYGWLHVTSLKAQTRFTVTAFTAVCQVRVDAFPPTSSCSPLPAPHPLLLHCASAAAPAAAAAPDAHVTRLFILLHLSCPRSLSSHTPDIMNAHVSPTSDTPPDVDVVCISRGPTCSTSCNTHLLASCRLLLSGASYQLLRRSIRCGWSTSPSTRRQSHGCWSPGVGADVVHVNVHHSRRLSARRRVWFDSYGPWGPHLLDGGRSPCAKGCACCVW